MPKTTKLGGASYEEDPAPVTGDGSGETLPEFSGEEKTGKGAEGATAPRRRGRPRKSTQQPTGQG
jgi:hypothetical protein